MRLLKMHQVISICLFLTFIATLSTCSEAKRGCSNYGHACYGGHGKRSDLLMRDNKLSIDERTPIDVGIIQEPDPNKLDRLYFRSLVPRINDNDQDNYLLYDRTTNKDFRYAIVGLLKQWIEDGKKSGKYETSETENLFKTNSIM